MIDKAYIKKILSTDQRSYSVGSKNVSTREAWLQRVLSEISAGRRLLDAGAGECQFKRFCGHLDYVSQDFAQYEGSGNNRGLQTGKWDTSKIDIVSDITAIPEPDGSFDVVLCTEVLEHIPQPVLALREFARLLKTGGILILTAPFCSLTHFAPYHFSTGFNRYFYQHHLESLGFEINDMTENGNFFEFMAQETRRIEDVAQQYGAGVPTKLERYAMRIMLAMFERFSAQDSGSKELLHFGYHVQAIKTRD